jgi:DNA-binding SARP family transcriptional activator
VAAVRDLEQGRRLRPRARSLATLVGALGLDACQAKELTRAAQHAVGAPAAGSGRNTADHAVRLRFQVLGPLAAWRYGAPVELGPPRQRAVLGLLALEPGALVHRETIIDALWGERPPETAVNLVQTYVSRLRRTLDPERSPRDPDRLFVSAGTSYRLRTSAGQLDLLDFRRLAGNAHASRDPVTACRLYEKALGLWRDRPLADVDLLRGHIAVAELTGQWATAVVEYAEAASGAGWHDRVLPHLRALAARDPLNEKAHACLVIMLAATGHQAAALRVYEDLRARLDDQLGIRPGPDVNNAYHQVLRQEVPTASHTPRPRQAPPPSVGLPTRQSP